MWYVQRPEELEDLSSYELLARYDNTGGKYHRLFVGPPMVPHYTPFLEARHTRCELARRADSANHDVRAP